MIELLDLPDEIILAIINQVKPRALLLCSILSIANNRLEQLALDKCHSIDLTFDYHGSPYEIFLRRFYSHVIPCIYYKIQSLTITLKQLLRIDVAFKAIGDENFPNLRHLKILSGRQCVNTGTPITIGSHYDSELNRLPLYSIVPQFSYFEGKFKDSILSFINHSFLMRSIILFEFDQYCALVVPMNGERSLFIQSTYLTHLSVTLGRIDDCIYLLNRIGSQLYSFTISIVHVYQGDIDIRSAIKSICCKNLKKLTMIMYRNIFRYEECILPLLQHFSNVEYLKLFLAITMIDNEFFDGLNLKRDIISFMPHLQQIHFHIRSILEDAFYVEIDQIHQSLVEYKSADCSLDYFNNEYGQCQIYSLPFPGIRLDFISNRFPLFDSRKIFQNVTMLLLFDDMKAFENDFFLRLTYALPHLHTLEIVNLLEQQEKTSIKTNILEFSHLSTLILHKIHMDYGEQFLCRALLPRLVELIIHDNVLLKIINENIQQARDNCANVERLLIVEPWIEPTTTHLTFFPKCQYSIH